MDDLGRCRPNGCKPRPWHVSFSISYSPIPSKHRTEATSHPARNLTGPARPIRTQRPPTSPPSESLSRPGSPHTPRQPTIAHRREIVTRNRPRDSPPSLFPLLAPARLDLRAPFSNLLRCRVVSRFVLSVSHRIASESLLSSHHPETALSCRFPKLCRCRLNPRSARRRHS